MYPTRKSIRAAANEWCARIQPTHHLRLSLLQARSIDPITKQQEHGNEVIYTKVYQGFVRSLSKYLAPNRNVWKRFKPILPNVGCLHGKWGNTSWHLHINLSVPERISDECLTDAIYETALTQPWVPNGAEYVNLSPIRSGGKAISYTMKEGFDYVMIV